MAPTISHRVTVWKLPTWQVGDRRLSKWASQAKLGRVPDDDLYRRALVAYFRSGGTKQPGRGPGVIEHEGRTYVVLENASETLAVYRVRTSGVLKRLKRWPAAVADPV
jgi:hypothetical protein